MKGKMKSYNDPFRLFVFECLQKVPYFEFLSEDDKNSLQFNFEQLNIKKGAHIQTVGDVPSNLVIIQKGIAEVYTTSGSQSFPIDYLVRGSVVNHNLFLIGSPVDLSIRCLSTVQVLNLSVEKVTALRRKNQQGTLN
jgi:CRP-like cAMP-binding protein